MTTILGSGLRSYILRHAREQALRSIAEAQAIADHILDETPIQVDSLRAEIQAKTQATTDEKRRRVLARARLMAKQTVILRRDEVMKSVWRQGQERLRGIADPARRLAIIRLLIDDAAAQLSGGTLEIQVNDQDRALLDQQTVEGMRAQLSSRHQIGGLTVAETAAPIWGGVIVRRVDGHQLVDNSFNRRLELVQRSLRDRVFRLLVAQGDDAPGSEKDRP